MRQALRSPLLRNGALRALLLSTVTFGASCESLDTTRIAPPKATLGDDIYGILCDRLGASVFREDLAGDSYRSICHYDAAGQYGDTVDQSLLPSPPDATATEARRLSVAKMERLAARRSDVIKALNAALPDTTIPDVVKNDGSTIRLHDALFSFAQALVPLYEQNPFTPGADPPLPAATRAVGRMLDKMIAADDALGALEKIWGRQGYRPGRVGLGIVQPVLAYPNLRDFTKNAVSVLGPGGASEASLQGLLKAVEKEMLAAKPTLSPLPDYAVVQATAQPNRPRSALEVAAAVALAQDPSYAKSAAEPPRYISMRDRRGFVIPLGSTPGVGGLPSPFADKDGDGYADVDDFGRFVDVGGAPLPLDPPFRVIGLTVGSVDAFERPVDAPYEYIDTSRALTGALARSLVPLLDATKLASAGDPAPWESEHETLMYALAGAYALYGDREPAVYDYDAEAILPGGSTCANCLPYDRFLAEDSPLVDLVYGLGQLLADEDSDALLLGLIDLVENHESEVARVLGSLFLISDQAKAHDELAAQGLEPKAELAYEVPIYDEMAQVLAAMADRPGLIRKLVGAMASPAVVTPVPGAAHLGESLSKFVSLRDLYQYDKNDLNGPAINLSVGPSSISDPVTPLDHNAPKVGSNQSLLQRSLRVIADANRLVVCNKQGTVVHTSLGIDYPIWPAGPLDACGLFRFENMGAFYLDTLLPDSHPKRATMKINDGTLNSLISFLNFIGMSADEMFEESSGIVGFTTKPTPQALSRFVFFGASSSKYPNMPDHDGQNQGGQTDDFITDVIDPASSAVCPKNGIGVHDCPSQDDTLRLRDPNSMFVWERLGFHPYLRPVLTVFANESCTADLSYCDQDDFTGEQLFLDLSSILHRHWYAADHGPECSSSGDAATNPKYCSGAGVNRYEPILKDAFAGDLVPALNALSQVTTAVSKVTVARGPKAGQVWTGGDVLEKLVHVAFSQQYAASVGLKTRQGQTQGHWVDGTTQPQVTLFNLLADAFHAMDQRFEAAGDPSRKAMWKRARSQLVDELLAVDGTGPGALFKNRATPKMLVSILKVLREQLNANCPDRESTKQCAWARQDLAKKLQTTLSGPMFASIVDLGEGVRTEDEARRALGRMLSYVLVEAADGGSAGDLLHATLSTMSDVLQVLKDDGIVSPIVRAMSGAAAPSDAPEGPGAMDTTIQILKALSSDEYDPYHVLDSVLPALVTPMPETGLTPVQVLVDVFADVHRIDASDLGPFASTDYGTSLRTLREFLGSETRGLEQFYYILQNRPR